MLLRLMLGCGSLKWTLFLVIDESLPSCSCGCRCSTLLLDVEEDDVEPLSKFGVQLVFSVVVMVGALGIAGKKLSASCRCHVDRKMPRV